MRYYNLAYMNISDGTASKVTEIKSSESPAAVEEGKIFRMQSLFLPPRPPVPQTI